MIAGQEEEILLVRKGGRKEGVEGRREGREKGRVKGRGPDLQAVSLQLLSLLLYPQASSSPRLTTGPTASCRPSTTCTRRGSLSASTPVAAISRVSAAALARATTGSRTPPSLPSGASTGSKWTGGCCGPLSFMALPFLYHNFCGFLSFLAWQKAHVLRLLHRAPLLLLPAAPLPACPQVLFHGHGRPDVLRRDEQGAQRVGPAHGLFDVRVGAREPVGVGQRRRPGVAHARRPYGQLGLDG
jgi:hypothetical protein